MDESSLEEAIEIYSTQLQQVQVALSEDLQQLTEPTESSLGSVKKSQLLASLEEPSTNQDATSVTQETGELSEDSAEVKQNAEPDEEEEEYHNAMVVCPEEARVRVLYLHPTNKSMKPCGFYLGGKYSHGEAVCVSELRDFLEADISNMESGSACLAKHEDGIWYPARISGGLYTVKFDLLLLKEAVLEADRIIPPLRQDDGSSSSSSDSEDDTDQCDAVYAKGVNSAEHTRGIGSKLLLKMGYELGKGLGETLSGRVEPVQAVVFPKDCSLDICAELTQRKTAAAIAKDNPASPKPKAKKRKASTSTRLIGVEAYRGGNSTKHSLTTEKVAHVEREIQQLTKSLSRRNGRDATMVSRIEEKLTASRKLLVQLKAQEQTIQREQKKADTHKKMTEF
uniref:Zinc finger, CCCH-type with G patch domain n=1 Tax=Sinocyclocheilus grahami TaxID=75366 RepID=A0A672PVN0_SINGR